MTAKSMHGLKKSLKTTPVNNPLPYFLRNLSPIKNAPEHTYLFKSLFSPCSLFSIQSPKYPYQSIWGQMKK